jgi:hypothetical protein
MPGTWERCGARQNPDPKSWVVCNRKAGHTGDHAYTKTPPVVRWAQETKENQQ